MNFSIIVPIKNQFKIIKMCLESIERHYKNEDVILIDDGSTEVETINLMKSMSSFNNWKLIKNEQSLGHTKVCEQGIRESKCENLFLLNSDTILTERSLIILSDVLNKNDNIAVVGPKTSSASGPQLSLEACANRWKWTIADIEKFAKECELNEDDFIDIPLVNGFCLGIKKSVFEKVGGFDENLSCYGNEKELLIRIRNAGCRTVFVQKSYVHHFGKISYSQEKINIGKAQINADLYILKKHGKLK